MDRNHAKTLAHHKVCFRLSLKGTHMFDVIETVLSSTANVTGDFLRGLVDVIRTLIESVGGSSSKPVDSVPLTPLVPATPVLPEAPVFEEIPGAAATF